jgi:hypothetical protein
MGAYSDALQRARPDDPTSVAGLLPAQQQQQRLHQLPQQQLSQQQLFQRHQQRTQEWQEGRGEGRGVEEMAATWSGGGGGDARGGWSRGQGGAAAATSWSGGGGGAGGRVAASSFRTYYPPLNKQSDFIQALRHVGHWVVVRWVVALRPPGLPWLIGFDGYGRSSARWVLFVRYEISSAKAGAGVGAGNEGPWEQRRAGHGTVYDTVRHPKRHLVGVTHVWVGKGLETRRAHRRVAPFPLWLGSRSPFLRPRPSISPLGTPPRCPPS